MRTMPIFRKPQVLTSSLPVTHSFPKKIFQTWDSPIVPAGMYAAMQSWLDLNPDWEYHLFTDDAARTFILQHFDKDVIEAFDQLVPGAYRADLWRYCVLYIYGGVYADTKLVLQQSLNTFLPANTDLIVIRDVNRHCREFAGYLWQAFLVAQPGLSIFKRAITMIVENVTTGNYGNDTLSITGPGLLGKAFNLALGRSATTPIALQSYHASGLTFAVHGRSKLAKEVNVALYGVDPCLYTYRNYTRDRLHPAKLSVDSLVRDYASCWFLSQVYRHGRCMRPAKATFFQQRIAKFWAKYIKAAYVIGNVTVARKRIQQAKRDKRFNIRLLLIWMHY